MQMPPEFVAMFLGLSIYTASFISEIVRAGILSVGKGQIEAAKSIGLKQNVIMNLIIIPQALRVIVPPLTSQFLNLTKNSSLRYCYRLCRFSSWFWWHKFKSNWSSY
jgi:general L-amino acid transport system permease protein